MMTSRRKSLVHIGVNGQNQKLKNRQAMAQRQAG